MSKINILDSSIYNQIAAGEVVENPASIVKELVENSVDSGAANISIMIEDGGIKSICIVDDGEGMTQNDLRKSILSHATSKIQSSEDLNTISTLGFRGEALASIASISRLEMKSKHIKAEIAYQLVAQGGDILEDGVTPLNKGTSICVSKLFYNTPARYKFLRSARSEENAITSLVGDIILANPEIAFKYYIDEKLMYASSGRGLENSVNSIYGEDIIDSLLEVDYVQPPYSINGYVAKPNSMAIKHNRNFQTFIINGRVIKDFTLSAIVQNAYAEKLMKRSFPIIVLDIVMPFGEVDVNVHPNKLEVRFSKTSKIKSVLYKAITSVLISLDESSRQDFPFGNKPQPKIQKQQQIPITKGTKTDFKSLKNYIEHKKDKITNSEADEIKKRLNYLAETTPKVTKDITRLKEEESNIMDEIVTKTQPTYIIVGQIFDTYIILETENTMYMIDQHAAHERILYDSYFKKLKQKPLDIQDLLVPFVYQSDAKSVDIILKNKDIIMEMGFVIEDFGNNLIKILSVPLQFVDIDIDNFITDIAERLLDITNIEDVTTIKQIIARQACKNAIKGGRSLSNEDIAFIMDKLFKDNIPLQCPHGRPVITKLSKIEIEKMFRRIV